jgi:hypothetical protein
MSEIAISAAAPGLPNSLRTAAQVRADRALRRRMERAVESLIALLDTLDPDPDFEDSDPPEDDGLDEDDGTENEPTLGAPEQDRFDRQLSWAKGSTRDGDAEISGCCAPTENQEHWTKGYESPDDAEDGHDREDDPLDQGEMDNSDLEPSCGAPELAAHQSQEKWARGLSVDGDE